MKKIAVLLFILILALPCCGCHATDQVPLSQVEVDLLTVSDNLSGMKKGDGKALKRYYGLNINDFKEALIYVPANYMDVSEILIIKVKDSLHNWIWLKKLWIPGMPCSRRALGVTDLSRSRCLIIMSLKLWETLFFIAYHLMHPH